MTVFVELASLFVLKLCPASIVSKFGDISEYTDSNLKNDVPLKLRLSSILSIATFKKKNLKAVDVTRG